MINEVISKRELMEENKIMEAIHNQARNNYYLEKGKRFLEAKKEQTKKEHEQKILEFIVCSVLVILSTAFLIFALVVRY